MRDEYQCIVSSCIVQILNALVQLNYQLRNKVVVGFLQEINAYDLSNDLLKKVNQMEHEIRNIAHLHTDSKLDKLNDTDSHLF